MSNPLGFSYSSVAGLDAYSKPSAVLITGRGNRYDPAFTKAREGGAEVYAYLNVVERPDKATSPLDLDFYMGDVSRVPLWVPPRTNFAGQMMTDMRVGSEWVAHCLGYIEGLMSEAFLNGAFAVDGVFLDVCGARLWSTLAAWDTWPQNERDEWTQGNVDFVRRLDQVRRSVNDEFKIVTNSMWETPAGEAGRQFVDGICLEHHPSTRVSARAAAARQYSPLGHRRVLWIANGTAEAQLVAALPGVTHVSDQAKYAQVTPPPVPFTDLRLGEAVTRYARLEAKNAELHIANKAMLAKLDWIHAHVAELSAGL